MEFSNCKWCGKQLDRRNGDECYQCFTVRLEVERNPEIARKVLAHLTLLAVDLPSTAINHCNPVNGVHALWCTGHEAANH